MSVDVMALDARYATASGDVYVHLGIARLNLNKSAEPSGTLVFPEVESTGTVVNWLAAEIIGLEDPSLDGIRIRLQREDGGQFYIDRADGKVKSVSDTSTWDSEYTPPYALSLLDGWTGPHLTVVVYLVSTENQPDPRFSRVSILVDFPAWEGAIAQCVREVAEFVRDLEPIIIHRETVSSDTQSWKPGKPYSEQGIQVTDVVQVTLDGVHKSSTYSNGVVTLSGPPAKTGQVVEIAMKIRATMTFRRVDQSRILHYTPAWLLRNAVVSGGLVGKAPGIEVGGYKVEERHHELRITIQGVATQLNHAFAMRLALQTGFADGLNVIFPGGRCVNAQLDGLIEIVEAGTDESLPMAQGVVILPVNEFVKATSFRKQRVTAEDVVSNPSLVEGAYVNTNLNITLPTGQVIFSFDDDGDFVNESPNQ